MIHRMLMKPKFYGERAKLEFTHRSVWCKIGFWKETDKILRHNLWWMTIFVTWFDVIKSILHSNYCLDFECVQAETACSLLKDPVLLDSILRRPRKKILYSSYCLAFEFSVGKLAPACLWGIWKLMMKVSSITRSIIWWKLRQWTVRNC